MTDGLLVTSSFLPGRGGIESYLAELCEELAPRLAVLAPARRDRMQLPTNLPYPTLAGPPLMLAPRPSVARAIVNTAERLDAKRVIFGTPWPLILVAPALAQAGLKYSVIAHGAELIAPGAVPGVSARVVRALAEAEVLFAVSDFTADHMRRLMKRNGAGLPPVEVLRARVDIDRFRPDLAAEPVRARYGIEPSDKVILSFGRLVARKGIGRLIKALPAIRRRVPAARLVIAGTGPEESRLRKMASTDRAVVFTGRVPDELAPSVYAMADVFALAVADRYRGLEVEGLGIVLLEAAACGLPCVTGRSGGTPEAVIDGSTGFVVDASDRDALIDRIAGLLENPHLARQMGARGRAHVAEHFHGSARLGPLVDWLNG